MKNCLDCEHCHINTDRTQLYCAPHRDIKRTCWQKINGEERRITLREEETKLGKMSERVFFNQARFCDEWSSMDA